MNIGLVFGNVESEGCQFPVYLLTTILVDGRGPELNRLIWGRSSDADNKCPIDSEWLVQTT
jgi:hypothetical protein